MDSRQGCDGVKIVQAVSNLAAHDAIGNEVLLMDSVLKRAGYETGVLTLHRDENVGAGLTVFCRQDIQKEDIIIFHKASGDFLTSDFIKCPATRVLLYHNITPARWFWLYDPVMAANQVYGRLQLRRAVRRADAVWADSAFNLDEIIRLKPAAGRLHVFPYLMPETESIEKRTPHTSADGTRLLCVGRIAPNKKLEDAIALYNDYRLRHDPDSVLELVGSAEGFGKYAAKLKALAASYGLTDRQVIFRGKISEAEKEACFRNAFALLCMSEHEGFCVPLIEAAERGLPVLAFAGRTAVGETLGDETLLFRKKDIRLMSDTLGRLKNDADFYRMAAERQSAAVSRFRHAVVAPLLPELIRETMEPGTAGNVKCPRLITVRGAVYKSCLKEQPHDRHRKHLRGLSNLLQSKRSK